METLEIKYTFNRLIGMYTELEGFIERDISMEEFEIPKCKKKNGSEKKEELDAEFVIDDT